MEISMRFHMQLCTDFSSVSNGNKTFLPPRFEFLLSRLTTAIYQRNTNGVRTNFSKRLLETSDTKGNKITLIKLNKEGKIEELLTILVAIQRPVLLYRTMKPLPIISIYSSLLLLFTFLFSLSLLLLLFPFFFFLHHRLTRSKFRFNLTRFLSGFPLRAWASLKSMKIETM